VYTNPENKNAQRHRQTDGQTDGQQDGANSRPYCVAVRSAKKDGEMREAKALGKVVSRPQQILLEEDLFL